MGAGAGCISNSSKRGALLYTDGQGACADNGLLGGAVSRMAGFPFQHTRHTNVTVMAAALTASILRPQSGSGGASSTSSSRTAAKLLDVVREAGSSGGDRLSFTVTLAPGEELELLTALVSNRDAHWADPVQAAAKQVRQQAIPW